MNAWLFKEPPNVAVFTSKRIVEGRDWIHYVTHDEEDGAWQFHPYSGPTSEAEASLVSLQTILRLDPSIVELADLPIGWFAWRDDPKGRWQRKRRSPNPE
jgi:hypothetical protein